MTLKLMIKSAKRAHKNAYAPYSKFNVGACLMDEHGILFEGCNVENASYGATICAESAALTSLVLHGSKKVKAVVVFTCAASYCPPCGLCLQRLSEFSDSETVVHMVKTDTDEIKSLKISEFLPYSFSAKNIHLF